MNKAQIILLELLGDALFHKPFDAFKYGEGEIPWQEVYTEAHKQTVASLAAEAVPSVAPRELRLQWIQDCYELERRGYEVLRAHAVLAELLRTNGIPFVILKGIASGSWYEKLRHRCYGDVDFLIDPADRKRVEALLAAAGYCAGKVLPYETDYEKDGVSFDMHIDINGIPEGSTGEALREELSDLLTGSVPCHWETELPIPDPVHHGLILLLHTARHLVSYGAGLRQLCDWAVFADSIGDEFPSLFEDKLKRVGLWQFASVMSAACVRYLHMPERDWIPDPATSLTERFMEDLLRKGNLHHDGDDEMDAVFIENTNRGGVGQSSMPVQLLKNLSEKVCFQWPIMAEHRILIPFGIVWMCVRYVWGVLTGSYKKTNLLKTVESAARRKKLYEELELFKGGVE